MTEIYKAEQQLWYNGSYGYLSISHNNNFLYDIEYLYYDIYKWLVHLSVSNLFKTKNKI